MKGSFFMKYILLPILFGFFVFHPLLTGTTEAFEKLAVETALPVTQVANADAALAASTSAVTPAPKPQNILQVWLTAYSSVPEQTDSTPFITASGQLVRDGIIASNALPFGTLVKIPSIFGEKIFTVEDRMSKKKNGFMDIWMPTTQDAIDFGIRRVEVVVVSPTLASAKDQSLE